MDAAPLPNGPLPHGPWRSLASWQVTGYDDVAQVRRAAQSAVSGHVRDAPAIGQPVFSSTAERLTLSVGELTTNGLRPGAPPVRVTLSRGPGRWLLVVSDGEPDRPPLVRLTPAHAVPGGLGLRLVLAMSQLAGWFVEGGRKCVWVIVGDEPPSSLRARGQ